MDPECWCADQAPNPWVFHSLEKAGKLEVSWQEWDELCADETVELIDVRDAAAHQAANAGGRWLPREQLSDYLRTLKPDTHVALYCQRGVRSLALVMELRALGFNQVMSIRGGMERRV